MGLAKTAALIAVLACAGCRASADDPKAHTVGAQPADEAGPVIETGVASRYADSLAGRPTASGETYDPNAMTCAHRKLPFGTRLHIKVLRTGAESTCRVNDRGPFAKDRILDMSRAVAEKAGVDGIAKVELHRID